MKNRFEVTLNGKSLTSLHDLLYITDIKYDSDGYKDNGHRLANRDGVFFLSRYYQATKVTVEFELHVYDPAERNNALQDIASWAARGGELTTSDRYGQFLQVICEQPPLMKSAQKWTDTLEVIFVAYNPPYWQASTPNRLTLTSGSENLFVRGNAGRTYADARITATSALTTVTMTANGNSIILSGLNIPAGGIIVLSHDIAGIQSITYNGVSLLSKRSGADELWVDCGLMNTFSFSTDGTASCEYSVRGLWH